MGPSERFILRWDGFMANSTVAFRELRGKEEFSDLTLVGSDGKQVRAHQVILAGGSSFIHKILRENPHPHPIVYLKGVTHEHLLSVLDFVYTGEANIVEDHLNEFLDIAEDLKVKGLTRNNTMEKADDKEPKSHPTTPASLEGWEAQEELGSSPKVRHYHSPISSQDSEAIEDRAPDPGVSHIRSIVSAPPQGPAATEGSASLPGVSNLRSLISAPSQGHVATEVSAPATKVSHQRNVMSAPARGPASTEERASTNPHNVTSFYSSNSSSLSAGIEDHDDTCNIKVEVGDAADYNVYYGTNEHGEAYISDVSLRVGDKIHGRVLSVEQEKNGHPLSTEEQIKEGKISDVLTTKATDWPDIMSNNEESSHDWYERSEENDVIMARDQDNHIELDIKGRSMKCGGDKEDMMDSNCDMVGTEVIDGGFVNEELAHNTGVDNMPDQEQDRGKTFQCLVCLKMFSTSSNLSRHKRMHTGEKPYQCQVCSKKFSHFTSLDVHKRVHTGEKPYQCSICPKTFSQSVHLVQHNSVHTGEKPYQCLLCSKRFSFSSQLSLHKKVHSDGSNKSVHNVEKPHQCMLCSQRFAQLIDLKRHRKKKNCSM